MRYMGITPREWLAITRMAQGIGLYDDAKYFRQVRERWDRLQTDHPSKADTPPEPDDEVEAMDPLSMAQLEKWIENRRVVGVDYLDAVFTLDLLNPDDADICTLKIRVRSKYSKGALVPTADSVTLTRIVPEHITVELK